MLAKRAERAGAKFFLSGWKVRDATLDRGMAEVRRDRASPLFGEKTQGQYCKIIPIGPREASITVQTYLLSIMIDVKDGLVSEWRVDKSDVITSMEEVGLRFRKEGQEVSFSR